MPKCGNRSVPLRCPWYTNFGGSPIWDMVGRRGEDQRRAFCQHPSVRQVSGFLNLSQSYEFPEYPTCGSCLFFDWLCCFHR